MARGFLSWLRQPLTPARPEPPAVPTPPGAGAAAGMDLADATPRSAASLDVELHESRTTQARLRSDLAELLKAHRQQARFLERSQRALREAEEELVRIRERAAAQAAETGQLRNTLATQTARLKELEQTVVQLEMLKSAQAALECERQELTSRLAEVGRSRDHLQAERERLATQIASLHATVAARDAAVAALQVAEDGLKERIGLAAGELTQERVRSAQLNEELQRANEEQAAHARVELEYQALSARWDVARAQLAEAEQALKTSQATIKAAHRLSSSVEWRGALDGVLDAASELVRFERGTLALVDELQEELKIEAARNSPIAVSEMSRFKVGEGIAGWALSNRQPVLVRDSRSDPRFKPSDPKHQPRSFIAVPLLAGEEALGVLTLARPANDAFSEHDLRTLARVGNDAAHALTNARLVHVLKQRGDDLSHLVHKTQELWAATDVNQAVEFVLRTARELVQGNAALLALRNPKTSELDVFASAGLPDPIVRERIGWGAAAAADVLRSAKPWVSPMREILPPTMVEAVESAGLRVLVSVPCGNGGLPLPPEDRPLLNRADVREAEEVVGVLNVYRSSPDPVSPGQVEQLQAFADQAAAAIQNMRRWGKIKEQLHSTASLNARLMGRERFIQQLQFRIQQLERELGRYRAA